MIMSTQTIMAATTIIAVYNAETKREYIDATKERTIVVKRLKNHDLEEGEKK
jgi:hypothetical protein